MQSKFFKRKFAIGACAFMLSLCAIYVVGAHAKLGFIQKVNADTYSFLLNKDNAPTLTGASKEQKDVVATGLGNPIYLTYSQASNAGYAHAVLANGGFISNNKTINNMHSLEVTGSGSFKLGYGIDTITNYINIALDDSSYLLEDVGMNFFKLVATSNNAVVYSIEGTDACNAKAEFGARQYSTSCRATDKWTRLVHDAPSSQAFTYSLSWTQTETTSGANYNPKIMLLDADALYNDDDSCVTVSDSNVQFGCRGIQFGQERQVINYKTAASSSNNVSSTSVAGTSKAGAANHFVGTDGTIFTTGLIDDASGKPVGVDSGQAGLGWSVLRVGATVNVTVTYSPDVDGLHQLEVVWHISKTVEDVDWSFTMTQRARFSGISNLALTAGSPNCNWTILSSSCTGLN